MIGHLTGKIITIKPTLILLDVNGVGYEIRISINTFERISGKESISLFIYTNVKEDSITLFGFYSEVEKDMFELLITINGVGPKSALSLLSGISTDDLKQAIVTNNVERMIAVPGIGRKTAERLILELKNKVRDIKDEGIISTKPSLQKEAVIALTTLGYNLISSEKVVNKILSELPDCSLEELIKRSLKELNR
ncbi:MAG: Holliday junction branch migration protein RuvA [Ignavibacteriota bacterium]|jgi:Holliday junction DNA helicase RuvA|nr:MAG: Holliday junction branch migration protein RuvA [Chlorobiota bacterium]MBE7475569.1 Holliday junction branch migration protein RuvA [Ignavibacteriales bacterium]MBL1123121.1 Holliday junction branch migration protein RuvA [Ignavibacteriota bacterium]MBV6419932.1 Holliday junction ATP-dependent DNA helicase RuvA [Ignavibacteriaceae bacterium]MCE7855666.1 Holliday junction branch migration protein RuvA [Ignavibacteria bacterium CHB3]